MEGIKETLRDNMHNSLIEIMETMAFMEAEPVDCPDSASALESADERWVTLLIHNPVQGEFRLQMSQRMLESIAESIYGLSGDELNEQLLDDTLAEMINTVVGHFLNKALPQEETYQLGLPEMGRGACPPGEKGDLVSDFSVEGEALRLVASGDALFRFSLET